MWIIYPSDEKCESFNTEGLRTMNSYDNGVLELVYSERTLQVQFRRAFSAHFFMAVIQQGLSVDAKSVLIQELDKGNEITPYFAFNTLYYVPTSGETNDLVDRISPRDLRYTLSPEGENDVKVETVPHPDVPSEVGKIIDVSFRKKPDFK